MNYFQTSVGALAYRMAANHPNLVSRFATGFHRMMRADT
jgi:hypothetical protein